jgi:hypothetical protein
MPRTPPLLLLLIAAALAACSEELRSSVSSPSPGAVGTPELTGPVAGVDSKASFEMDAPPIAEVGNLCTYRTRKDPVMQGHSDRTGAHWEGEVRVRDLPSMDPKWFSPSDKRMATLVAKPRVESFRTRVDDNCYNAQSKTYHACTKVLEADLTKIRGFARALTIERARTLAVLLCEKKVAEVVAANADIRQDNFDLKCRVVEQAFCDLPPAPPPAPATAKKK